MVNKQSWRYDLRQDGKGPAALMKQGGNSRQQPIEHGEQQKCQGQSAHPYCNVSLRAGSMGSGMISIPSSSISTVSRALA